MQQYRESRCGKFFVGSGVVLADCEDQNCGALFPTGFVGLFFGGLKYKYLNSRHWVIAGLSFDFSVNSHRPASALTASSLVHRASNHTTYNRNAMNRYDIGQKLGEGSFGTVFLAKKKRTGEEVRFVDRTAAVLSSGFDSNTIRFCIALFQRAVKCIRGESSWEDLCQMRELKSILCIPPHSNVVQLYEVHREHDGLIRFVFEYMPSGSLLDLIEDRSDKKRGPPPDVEIRHLVYQILKGVQHLHIHGIFHRDIKPENILLAGSVCKVADFSLAREQKEDGPPTSYISTRWYRAPEILLASKMYSSAVDIWAIGCIAAELYKLDPLFPGSDEIDQLRLIFHAFGTPEMVGWKDGTALLEALQVHDLRDPVKMFADSRSFLQTTLNVTDPILVDFLLSLLTLDPVLRSDATDALSHEVFDGFGTPSREKSQMRSERRKRLEEFSECCSSLSSASSAHTSTAAMVFATVSNVSPQHLKDSLGTSTVGNHYVKHKHKKRKVPQKFLSKGFGHDSFLEGKINVPR